MASEKTESPEKTKRISREIIKFLIENPHFSRNKITNIKGKIGKRHNYKKVIKNATILGYATPDEKEIILPMLKR